MERKAPVAPLLAFSLAEGFLVKLLQGSTHLNRMEIFPTPEVYPDIYFFSGFSILILF